MIAAAVSFFMAGAGVALTVMVLAQGIWVVDQPSLQQSGYLIVGTARGTGIQLNARLAQGDAGTAARSPRR